MRHTTRQSRCRGCSPSSLASVYRSTPDALASHANALASCGSTETSPPRPTRASRSLRRVAPPFRAIQGSSPGLPGARFVAEAGLDGTWQRRTVGCGAPVSGAIVTRIGQDRWRTKRCCLLRLRVQAVVAGTAADRATPAGVDQVALSSGAALRVS